MTEQQCNEELIEIRNGITTISELIKIDISTRKNLWHKWNEKRPNKNKKLYFKLEYKGYTSYHIGTEKLIHNFKGTVEYKYIGIKDRG